MTQRTALIIGGTGMLAAATRWLIAEAGHTINVARHASAFAAKGSVDAVDADWTSPSFAAQVTAAFQKSGPITTALLWLHDPAPTLAWLLPHLTDARVVLVLGNMDGNPVVPAYAAHLTTVRLGSERNGNTRRWLTHGEISAGAIAALIDGHSRTIGSLTPL